MIVICPSIIDFTPLIFESEKKVSRTLNSHDDVSPKDRVFFILILLIL